jgi:hypothetical protein
MQLELPASAHTDLEQRKEALRERRSTRPFGPEESRRQDDARWALESPEVLARYRGQFVVPYRREVVAHGTDAGKGVRKGVRNRMAHSVPDPFASTDLIGFIPRRQTNLLAESQSCQFRAKPCRDCDEIDRRRVEM